MHEWSLAAGIIQTVEDECRRQSIARVQSLELSVGELAQIEVDTLREALSNLKKGTAMAGCRITIRKERTRMSCRKCMHAWSFMESRKQLSPLQKGGDNAVHYLPSTVNAFITCPSCGSPDFDIVSGFGLSIRSFTADGRKRA